jgi:hypothetical protein
MQCVGWPRETHYQRSGGYTPKLLHCSSYKAGYKAGRVNKEYKTHERLKLWYKVEIIAQEIREIVTQELLGLSHFGENRCPRISRAWGWECYSVLVCFSGGSASSAFVPLYSICRISHYLQVVGCTYPFVIMHAVFSFSSIVYKCMIKFHIPKFQIDLHDKISNSKRGRITVLTLMFFIMTPCLH